MTSDGADRARRLVSELTTELRRPGWTVGGGVDALILVLSDTRHNRELPRAHADDLVQGFSAPGRRSMELLAAGVYPGGNAIVLL